MTIVHVGENKTISVLVDAMRAVSRETDPNRVLYAFASRLWKIRPIDAFVSISTRGLAKGTYKITRRFRAQDVIALSGTGDGKSEQDPWRDWASLPTLRGGFIGEIIAEGEPRIVHDLDLSSEPELRELLSDMGSCLAIPLYDEGEPINWTFQFRSDPDGFTINDLEQLLLTANLFGNATRNLVALKQVRELHRQLEKQAEEVARVQQMLLPKRIPKIPGLEIATSYLTSQHAGGDYYDFFEFQDGRWGILIADVSGHGAGAATVMAMLHAILHGYEGRETSAAAILRYANQRLVAAALESMFVTAFLGVYDPATAVLEYSRSGHNPPLLKRGNSGRVRLLDGASTFPLGIFGDYEPPSERVQLDPKDTIVLYTDGITEAFGPGGVSDMFGLDGLRASLNECSGAPECVVDSVHAALYRHTGSRDRDDDQTIVAFQLVGAAEKDES